MKTTNESRYSAQVMTRTVGYPEYKQPVQQHHFTGTLTECMNWMADLAMNVAVRVETASLGRILAEAPQPNAPLYRPKVQRHLDRMPRKAS